MTARLPNVRRAIFALLGTFVLFVPSLVSGCGTTSTPPINDVAGDAAVHFVNVITAGGGDGKSVPPAGPGASGSAAGSGSDGTSGSGDSDESGTVSSSGDSDESGTLFGSSGSSGSGTLFGQTDSSVSGSSSGSGSSPDSGTDGGPSVVPDASNAPGVCDDYKVTPCGSAPCDLRSNTCCVSETTFATRCLPGTNAACTTKEATLHCSNGCECSDGKVCCGISNTIAGSIQSVCQAVPNGGQCSPYPPTSTQASAQFCKADSQCKNGQGCIHQTCTYEGVSGTFDICGLQSGCQ